MRTLLASFQQSAVYLLFQRLAVYSFSASISQGMMMIYAIIVARDLGPENYGLLAGNYALVGFTIFFVNWGMDTWMLRESGIRPDLKSLSSTVLQTKFLTGAVWFALLVLAAPIARPDLFPRVLLAICAFDILADSFFNTIISGLNLEKQTVQASKLLFFSRFTRLVGAIALVLMGGSRPEIFALFRAVSTLLGFVGGMYIFKPLLNPARVPLAAVKTIQSSISFVVPELLSLIYAQVDVTLLSILATKKIVGDYAPAVSLVNALFVVFTAVFYILMPSLSKVYHSSRQQFQRRTLQVFGLYALLGLALSLLSWFLVRPLVTVLLGPDYNQTTGLIGTLSPILFLKALSFACITYLVVVGWQTQRIWVQVVSAVANVGLNLWFIPLYGAAGAANIYLISEAVLFFGYLLLVVLHHKRIA